MVDFGIDVDFSAEMERTLQILDYAILVISGADGVQGHTETLWRLLSRYQIPVFLFINKMDQRLPVEIPLQYLHVPLREVPHSTSYKSEFPAVQSPGHRI